MDLDVPQNVPISYMFTIRLALYNRYSRYSMRRMHGMSVLRILQYTPGTFHEAILVVREARPYSSSVPPFPRGRQYGIN